MAKFDPAWRYSWGYYPNHPQSTYCSEGVANLDPHEDKVDDSDDGDDDDDHGDCKCGATSRLGRTCFLCSTI